MLHKNLGREAKNCTNTGFLTIGRGHNDYKETIKKRIKGAIDFCNSFFCTIFYERLDNWWYMGKGCYL